MQLKIRASENSLDIQQELFSRGYYRLDAHGRKSTMMKLDECKYFICSKNGRIDFTNSSELFKLCPAPEVTLERLKLESWEIIDSE